MKHFRLERPSIINQKRADDSERLISCEGSLQPITITEEKFSNDGQLVACCVLRLQKNSGSAYKCTECYFQVHERCTEELPVEIEHPMHPEHPLTLLPRACSSRFLCNACDKYMEALPYHCFVCNFNLDLGCAVRTRSVKLETHVHPVRPMLSPASFECDACGSTEPEDSSFICNICSFWIHKDCALFPITFQHFSHVHPLNLMFLTFPHLNEHWCGVCKERIDRHFWFYVCDGCSYFVHANCSRKKRESETAIMVEGLDAANPIYLPVPDESESVNLVDQFMKQICQRDIRRGAELNHFSHDHPLSLSTTHSDDNLCSTSKLPISNVHKNDKICYACERLISAPFYSCDLCNFFLHKWCAELRKELQHPCHEHSLILFAQRPKLYEFFKCKCCQNISNKFTFQCEECYYNLDVKCASLPNSVMHEVHEHLLLIKKDCITEGCVACDRRIEMFSYGCDTCNFNLHYKCALLPRTISHRFDKHPFTLTYAPIDGVEEYYCEFCEGEIDPKWWFYHCIICDRSACVKCIYKDQI